MVRRSFQPRTRRAQFGDPHRYSAAEGEGEDFEGHTVNPMVFARIRNLEERVNAAQMRADVAESNQNSFIGRWTGGNGQSSSTQPNDNIFL